MLVFEEIALFVEFLADPRDPELWTYVIGNSVGVCVCVCESV